MKTLYKFLIVSIFFSFLSMASAQDGHKSNQAFSIPNVYIGSDSEGFSTYKYSAGYMPLYEHGEKYTGVNYQRNYFTQGSWNSDAEIFTFLTKAINPRTSLGYNLMLGYNLQNGYKLLTTDSSYSFSISETTKTEIFINRDRVETQNSLINGVYYTFGGASIEQQINTRLTGIIMAGNMYFSDRNTRPILKTKLIYDLIPDYGLTTQLRYRQFRNTNTNVLNNYFNPEEYSEAMIAFGARKRISGWVLTGTLGVGRQKVDQDPSTTTQLFELSVTSPAASNSYYFKARAGYSRSASFSSPNYLYRYFMEEVVFPF